MAGAVDSMVHFSNASSGRAQNTLVKALYLKRINRLLQDEPQEVISRLESLRRSLCSFSNIRLLVVSDLTKLPKPVSSWDVLSSALDTSLPLGPLDSRKAVLSDASRNLGQLSYIIPMPTIDSSFGLFTGKGPDSYSHPQLPALMVALAYLEAVEGPLWVAVRGTGLAYGVSFSRGTDTGMLGFNIYRSPDAFKAYNTSRQVIKDYVDGTTEFDKFGLEGAISSIVVQFTDEQPTAALAANLGFVNTVIRDIGKDWATEMLKKVRAVTVQQIKEVLEKVVLPIFEPGKTDMVVTCATIMEEVSH